MKCLELGLQVCRLGSVTCVRLFLRILAIHGVKITTKQTPWYILLDIYHQTVFQSLVLTCLFHVHVFDIFVRTFRVPVTP